MVSLEFAPYRSVIARRGYIGDLRARQSPGNWYGLPAIVAGGIIEQK